MFKQPYQFNFPYSKYLELVVKILESQPSFHEKLKGMSEAEIKVEFIIFKILIFNYLFRKEKLLIIWMIFLKKFLIN